jgi:hypothetical protein
MRFAFTKLSLALVAVVCASAAGATVAQATQGPIWHIEEKYLKANESLELAAGSGEFAISTVVDIDVTCTKQAYENASIEGGSSIKGSAQVIKVTDHFSGCTVTGDGPACRVPTGAIKTGPLEGQLAYATKERTGKILILFGHYYEPARTIWWNVKFEGSCYIKQFDLEGSAVAELVTAGKTDEVGKEAEATVQQARFPTSEIRSVWVEKEGELVEEPVELEVLGGKTAVPSGVSNLELTKGYKWGAFTS